jgi:branched-subunit amino acid aminotransferase/4-amino-4-deoxychorismate lyase
VATVQGRLRPGCDTLDAFRAAFPGGSITGAPKIRAMQIIDELEPCRRNVYTGALGWIGFDGDCDLNISIRTMIRRGDRVDYHTGGGVVWDSDPDAEHAEAIVKGRAMREALVGGPRDGAPPGIGPWIMHGDELVPASEARVSPLADGFMFAHGLFETMRAIDSRPAFLSRHLARLAGGSRILGLDKPTTPEEWLGRLQRLAAVNGLRDGVIKLVRYRDVAGVGELALVRGAPPASAAGWRVRAAAFPRSGSMHAVKSIAYIENILSRRAAQADGYDDVLFSDPAGNILEGSATNVFAVVDGVICTPPADSMLLPGIAREVVLEISGARARLCPLTPDLVAAAQEIFVTNAVVGVVPVVEYAGRCFSAGDNRVCAEVASEFFRLQRESLVG